MPYDFEEGTRPSETTDAAVGLWDALRDIYGGPSSQSIARQHGERNWITQQLEQDAQQQGRVSSQTAASDNAEVVSTPRGGGRAPYLTQRPGQADNRQWDPVRQRLADQYPDHAAYIDAMREPYLQRRDEARRAGMVDYYRQNAAPNYVTADYWLSRLPFSPNNLIRAVGQNRSAGRIQDGTATRDDYAEVGFGLALQDQQADRGLVGRGIDIATQAPGFGAEMAMTGGVFRLGSGLAQRALPRAVPILASRIVGGTAGLAAQTAVNPVGLATATAREMAPTVGLDNEQMRLNIGEGRGLGVGLARGFADQAIELGTERAGGLVGLGPVGNRLPAFLRAPAGRLANWARASQFNGIAGEIFEERLGDVIRGATGLADDYGMFSNPQWGRQLASEAIGFGLYGSAAVGGARAYDRVLNGRMPAGGPQIAAIAPLGDFATPAEVEQHRVHEAEVQARNEQSVQQWIQTAPIEELRAWQGRIGISDDLIENRGQQDIARQHAVEVARQAAEVMEQARQLALDGPEYNPARHEAAMARQRAAAEQTTTEPSAAVTAPQQDATAQESTSGRVSAGHIPSSPSTSPQISTGPGSSVVNDRQEPSVVNDRPTPLQRINDRRGAHAIDTPEDAAQNRRAVAQEPGVELEAPAVEPWEKRWERPDQRWYLRMARIEQNRLQTAAKKKLDLNSPTLLQVAPVQALRYAKAILAKNQAEQANYYLSRWTQLYGEPRAIEIANQIRSQVGQPSIGSVRGPSVQPTVDRQPSLDFPPPEGPAAPPTSGKTTAPKKGARRKPRVSASVSPVSQDFFSPRTAEMSDFLDLDEGRALIRAIQTNDMTSFESILSRLEQQFGKERANAMVQQAQRRIADQTLDDFLKGQDDNTGQPNVLFSEELDPSADGARGGSIDWRMMPFPFQAGSQTSIKWLALKLKLLMNYRQGGRGSAPIGIQAGVDFKQVLNFVGSNASFWERINPGLADFYHGLPELDKRTNRQLLSAVAANVPAEDPLHDMLTINGGENVMWWAYWLNHSPYGELEDRIRATYLQLRQEQLYHPYETQIAAEPIDEVWEPDTVEVIEDQQDPEYDPDTEAFFAPRSETRAAAVEEVKKRTRRPRKPRSNIPLTPVTQPDVSKTTDAAPVVEQAPLKGGRRVIPLSRRAGYQAGFVDQVISEAEKKGLSLTDQYSALRDLDREDLAVLIDLRSELALPRTKQNAERRIVAQHQLDLETEWLNERYGPVRAKEMLEQLRSQMPAAEQRDRSIDAIWFDHPLLANLPEEEVRILAQSLRKGAKKKAAERKSELRGGIAEEVLRRHFGLKPAARSRSRGTKLQNLAALEAYENEQWQQAVDSARQAGNVPRREDFVPFAAQRLLQGQDRQAEGGDSARGRAESQRHEADESAPGGDADFEVDEFWDERNPDASSVVNDRRTGRQTGQPISQFGIIKQIEKLFGLAIYRSANLGKETRHGMFNTRTDSIMLAGKSVGRISVTIHEAAHWISKHLGLMTPQRTAGLPAGVMDGLRLFDYNPDRKDRAVAFQEGFAEYVRMRTFDSLEQFIDKLDAAKQQRARHAAEWAEQELRSNDDVLRKLDRVRTAVRDFTGQTGTERFAGMVSTSTEPEQAHNLPLSVRVLDRLRELRKSFNQYWKNDVDFANRIDAQARKGGYKAPPGRGVEQSILIARNQAERLGDEFIRDGTKSLRMQPDGMFHLTKIGPSLAELLDGLTDQDLNPMGPNRTGPWELYVIAKHIEEETARGRKPIGEESMQYLREFAAELNQKFKLDPDMRARYESARVRLSHAFNSQLQALVDAGRISQQEMITMVKDKGIYAPLSRVFEGRRELSGGRSGQMDDGLRARHGSDFQIAAPLSVLMKRAAFISKIVVQQEVNQNLLRTYDSAREGMGHFMQEIPAPKTPVTASAQQMQQMLESLQIPDEVVADILDLMGDQTAIAFKPAEIVRGAQETVAIYQNGRPRYFRVKDHDLYDYLSGYGYAQNAIPTRFVLLPLRMILATTKFGAVKVNQMFAVANPIRDFGAFLQGTSDIKSAVNVPQWLYYSLRAVMHRARGITPKGAPALVMQELNRGGGDAITTEPIQRFGYEFTGGTNWSAENLNRKYKEVINSKEKRGAFNVVMNLGGLALRAANLATEAMNSPENAYRGLEAWNTLKRLGYTDAKIKDLIDTTPHTVDPLPYDHAVEMLSAAAEVTTNFSKLGKIPRALNKYIPFFGPFFSGWNTAFDNLRKRPARFAALMAVYAGLELLHHMAFKDEPWYEEEEPWLRYGFWAVPIGGRLYRIPKPYGFLRIGAGLMAESLRTVNNKNPKWRALMQDTGSQLTPPFGLLETALQLGRNQDWAGRPIVPRHVEGMAASDQLPYQARYLLDQTTGGMFNGNRYTQVPLRVTNEQQVSVQDYYARLKELDGEAASARAAGRPFADSQARDRLHAVQSLMQDINRVRRTATEQDRRSIDQARVQIARLGLGTPLQHPLRAEQLPVAARGEFTDWLRHQAQRTTAPRPERRLGEATAHFNQRVTEWRQHADLSGQLLGRLGFSREEVGRLGRRLGARR